MWSFCRTIFWIPQYFWLGFWQASFKRCRTKAELWPYPNRLFSAPLARFYNEHVAILISSCHSSFIAISSRNQPTFAFYISIKEGVRTDPWSKTLQWIFTRLDLYSRKNRSHVVPTKCILSSWVVSLSPKFFSIIHVGGRPMHGPPKWANLWPYRPNRQ